MAATEPHHFFDHFSRFVETSETGQFSDRLNARYVALIHSNRELLHGARVLDLASHDGRFSFAALENGASHVVGVEHEPHLVQKSNENMEHYGVPRAEYEFVLGDMFAFLDRVEEYDVVFCFGILYHINHHMLLLSKIAAGEPAALIIDSNISHYEQPVIELRNPLVGSPPPPGSELEGWPSHAAFDAMFSSFGWSHRYFDWAGSGLADSPRLADYRAGRRVTAVVTCGERTSPERRERAVQEVQKRRGERRSQWPIITQVASEFETMPQKLATWVRRAELGAHGQPNDP